MTDTLKPCPFCGSDKLRNRPAAGGGYEPSTATAIFCFTCGARGSREPNKAAAYEAWNHRSPDRELVDD